MTKEINNSEDILDSRDIQERFDELTENIVSGFTWNFNLLEMYQTNKEKTIKIIEQMIDRDKIEEWDFEEWQLIYNTFGEFMDDSNWDAMTFLNDSYTDESWAEDQMKEFGYLSNDISFIISNNIDFAGIVEDLLQDYNEINFDGVTFHYEER